MKASLQFKITQGLRMTPQLQQAIHLLQLSNIELNAIIQEQLDSNMMLEIEEADSNEDLSSTEIEKIDANGSNYEEFDPNEESSKSDIEYNEADYVWNEVNSVKTTQKKNNLESGVDKTRIEEEDDKYKSLHEELRWQLNLMPISDNDRVIAEIIVDSLNDDGFLENSLNDVLETVKESLEDIFLEEVEAVLKIIQSLEPAGVGARSAKESLLIQLCQFDQKIPEVKKAKEVIENYFDYLVNHDYKKILKKLKLSENELKKILVFIQKKLNARPGSQINNSRIEYTIPDVNVKKENKKWVVKLNQHAIPMLRINTIYKKMIHRGDNSNDNKTLKSHLQDAEWTIKSLRHRNDTLLSVAKCIVEHQSDFLEHGDKAMKPLILQDVASSLDMNESTISRATTKKYMQTPRGVFELKYFFSSHINTDQGDSRSSTAIRAMIKNLIDNEPSKKPLSDEKISLLLKKEGIIIARRTVAKYREAMAIPPSNERKRLSI